MLTAWQEFDRLKEGESVYKLVGPVLLKQDKFEAEGTVKGRLEFIGNEMYVPYPLSYFPYFPSLPLPLTFYSPSLSGGWLLSALTLPHFPSFGSLCFDSSPPFTPLSNPPRTDHG
ncbi:hypothetical protein IMZ48_11770 [Candidatus Bathyarchaeota archaeon]|nr:hypothetical protein [Candidatus Bathyarchaeota archaeon]